MREVFQQEVREVQDGLVEIAELVVVAIRDATAAFNDADLSLADATIADGHKIDDLAVLLDELSIQILARQQPVARDLRIVVSALRISASLERMGDLAEHIAQLTRYRHPNKVVPQSLQATFVDMGRLDVLIAEKVVALLRTQDLAVANEIPRDDDLVDELHRGIFEEMLGDTWSGQVEDTVDVTLASRYHERFADHAVSIAKKVTYLGTGNWTRSGNSRLHDPRKGPL